MTYYKHIDGLRALAVLSVIFVHLNFTPFSGGYVGVDVFFVISGFLITNIIVKEINQTGNFCFINFYTRRVRRILPALAFVLFISFILSIWLLNIAQFKIFGGSLATASISFSNVFFYNQAGYFDIFSQSNPLLHTWSLGVEEQFYIFWPIMILIFSKVNRKLLIPTVIVIFLLSLGWSIHRQDVNLSSLYYLAPFRAFEFCVGAILVFVDRQTDNGSLKTSLFKEICCVIGFVFIIYPIFSYDSSTLFPSYNALLPCFGAVLLIYSGTAKFTGYLLRNSVVGFIGLISYSLYLVHWPLIVFVKTYNQDIGQSFDLSTVAKYIILASSILIATLMYYFIEQPFRKSIPKNKSKQIWLLLRWSVVVLFFLIIGGSIFYSKGWIWRAKSPNALAKVDDISKYHEENWGGSGFSGGLIFEGRTPYPNIVTMGDSHSGMLDTGIVDEIAKPNNLTVFTVSGGGAGKYASSLLLPGITRINANQELFDRSAKTGYKEAISQLLKSKNSILIYSASYSYQLNIAGYLKNHKSLNINTSSMTSYKDYKPFTNSLDKLLKLMDGHKLIIIGDVPGASKFNVMNCITKLKWFNSDNCLPTQKENLSIAAINVNKILKEYASKHKNVYFINPFSTFCKDDYCKNLDINGTPFYSDGHHLSKTGSIYFISHVENQIINIIDMPLD
ncbi:acyltransferase family protein [Francisella sp. LA112445]|uniref:acyltransferase family protein n=1 Tax=Francisella sp. LA112445 TaxID=1395624 RepID=UPI001788B8FD|nr:acyltransferase family protein [Francisella sp. LA112445]QIW09341.1 acyltransferase [Francisella sp. LA112445]